MAATKTSPAGRALIEQREGKRLTAYRDSVGVLTIGVGHTGRMAPPPVTAGMRITQAQCDAFLAVDLAPVEAVIARDVRVPISASECDALASLGFNIGSGGLAKSTVIKRLNLGDVTGAADAFLMWSKPSELVGRRRAERLQFLQPDGATAVARAGALQVAATTAKAKARTAQLRGGSVAGAGTLATAAVVGTGHPAAGAAVGILALIAAGFDAWLARSRHAQAATLAANAGTHADAIPAQAAA